MTDEDDTRPYYCVVGDCMEPIVGEVTTGVQIDPAAEDGFWEDVELVCEQHTGEGWRPS